MNLAEFRQLKKLLTLATSANDHEALASWRKATELVARHGYTWEMVLDRVCTVINEVEAVDDPDEMAEKLELALRGASGSFRDTVLSIQAQYESRGWLSDAQRKLIEDAADRTVDRHPGGRFR